MVSVTSSVPSSTATLPSRARRSLFFSTSSTLIPLPGVAESARALFIGERTVQTHLTHIYPKLGVASRAGAIAVARDRELV